MGPALGVFKNIYFHCLCSTQSFLICPQHYRFLTDLLASNIGSVLLAK